MSSSVGPPGFFPAELLLIKRHLVYRFRQKKRAQIGEISIIASPGNDSQRKHEHGVSSVMTPKQRNLTDSIWQEVDLHIFIVPRQWCPAGGNTRERERERERETPKCEKRRLSLPFPWSHFFSTRFLGGGGRKMGKEVVNKLSLPPLQKNALLHRERQNDISRSRIDTFLCRHRNPDPEQKRVCGWKTQVRHISAPFYGPIGAKIHHQFFRFWISLEGKIRQYHTHACVACALLSAC